MVWCPKEGVQAEEAAAEGPLERGVQQGPDLLGRLLSSPSHPFGRGLLLERGTTSQCFYSGASVARAQHGASERKFY